MLEWQMKFQSDESIPSDLNVFKNFGDKTTLIENLFKELIYKNQCESVMLGLEHDGTQMRALPQILYIYFLVLFRIKGRK